MPPEQDDQRQRQLDALQQYVSNLGAKGEEPPATEPPPSGPRRVPWGRTLLALALVAAALLSGILIARTLRSGGSACATGGVTPTAVVVGDSISTVTAPAGPNIAFPLVAARLLGWHVKVDAHPDTGFTTPNGRDAQHPSFAATARCVAALHPRIVIVALGSDDAEQADRARMVQSRATEGLADLHRRLSRAQIVVVGPLPSGSTPSQALQAVRGAVRAAAQAAHVGFIDPIAEGWITGARSDPESGNANRMISADGRHLTPAGHAYVGLRLATDLSRLGLASR
ncbi:MAG TPA: SGNH/GDSL hydrolase family protein [Actinomycetes bacterium]|nr:SGNH/GDSL hydrolase family protein [Actinomycetes bacterium]